MDIEAVMAKYEEQLMELPNVIGVGIGIEGDKKIIKVFVRNKIPESSLNPDEIIPKLLGGFEVKVEEIGRVRVY